MQPRRLWTDHGIKRQSRMSWTAAASFTSTVTIVSSMRRHLRRHQADSMAGVRRTIRGGIWRLNRRKLLLLGGLAAVCWLLATLVLVHSSDLPSPFSFERILPDDDSLAFGAGSHDSANLKPAAAKAATTTSSVQVAGRYAAQEVEDAHENQVELPYAVLRGNSSGWCQ